MGTNCAPHLANLFLDANESSYIDKLINGNNFDKAKNLPNLF